MGEDSAKIIKRKMECSGRDKGPVDLIKDSPTQIGAQAVAAFSEYYGEKCESAEGKPAEFCRLGDALSKYGSESAIYHFRQNGEAEFILIFDIDTSLRAAGWSLSGSRDLPDPTPENVSAIDRRLAKKLAIRTAECSFENADKCGLLKGGIELLASGGDPRRFEFNDDQQKSILFSIDIQTIEGEAIGSVTMIVAEKSLIAMRRYYETTLVLAEQKWTRDLAKLAATSPIAMRAVLTEQMIDIKRLMNLQAGEVINLNAATIDDVAMYPALKTKSKLALNGALGNREGARALKVTDIKI
ncbi:FliM/FliN family flagellar motor switch protein [Hyphococcus lacteus]|uniref:FliM/FliN family flagellar motor switch protein n=1 Tax=Hyphococcus lacteus TaxID=3143536 RepID=A0ABV3ZAQ1_9PROT